MASTLLEMASNLRAIASNLIAVCCFLILRPGVMVVTLLDETLDHWMIGIGAASCHCKT